MQSKYIILLIALIGVLCCNRGYAQLSDEAINDVADRKAHKMQEYLNLTDHRRDMVKDIIYKNELAKGELLKNNLEILNESFDKQDKKLAQELSNVLTSRELMIFQEVSRLDLKDDKDYLTALTEVYDADEHFIKQYMNFRNEVMLPKIMELRFELDEQISREDKREIDSLRDFVYKFFDKCLVSCVINNEIDIPNHDHGHEHKNENLLININHELSEENSKLSKLLELIGEYEDDIHKIRIANNETFKYWGQQSKLIRDEYILPNHKENLRKIKKRNEVANLKHIESEAIFLLIDPMDERKSRYFFNFGLLNDL